MGSPYLCLSRGVVVVFAAVLIGATPVTQTAGAAGLEGNLEGVLNLVWGDGSQEAPGSVGPIPSLTDDAGQTVVLELDAELTAPLGGLLALNGRRVSVHGSWSFVASDATSRSVLTVDFIAIAAGEAPDAVAAVAGSQPWVSILCKFNNISSEPKALDYFQDMFSNSAPRLDHYWREVSYDNINVVGSTAAGWVTLPQNQTYYVPTPGSGCGTASGANLDLLFAHCTAAANSLVDFSNGGNPYAGINLMFNGDLDGCAWGGFHWATLDGVSKSWRTTWEPLWGYQNITVMEHEMGHGFGLPHSCFNPTSVYDNAWDVMSDTWTYTVSSATYGRVGQHTISYHKDLLGWFRNPEKITVEVGNSTTVPLTRLAVPYSPGPKMVKIPIDGSATHFYTVEARQEEGYDVSLPGDAVIVHEVLTGRSEPAHVQGSNGGTGAMGTPGRYFWDSQNSIGIAVLAATGGGFEVAVSNGSKMAAFYPEVDVHGDGVTSSNLNGVFEPGERVLFEPAWSNVSPSIVSPTSCWLSNFNGPGGATYTINNNLGDYGSVAPVTTASCSATGNCYRLVVSNPASRPALHWDATVTESLSDGGGDATWTLHIGSSFDDVPAGNWAYTHIENLLHSGITAGCGGGLFCPGDSVNRWQIAVFLAKALTGGSIPTSGTVEGLGSYNCVGGGSSVFADIPPSDAACPAIHYIAKRGITAGCGGGDYCPWDPVSRWQMGVFLAKAMAGNELPVSGTVPGMGSYNCTSGGSSVFSDVAPANGGCAAIHFLAAEDVTEGCGGSNYCPSADVTRAQMAVFITKAFGLRLYAP
jgi:M6 family metalloprotease-like protein